MSRRALRPVWRAAVAQLSELLQALVQPVSASVQAVLLGLVRFYRFALSPWLGSACRFTPTCSQYALEALQTHGPWVGGYLASWRVLRCHPWCDGGHDPVPPRSHSSSVSPHP
ncbi:MAG: hypothetical protein RI920_946 [Pseudomonadota bacterium]|jgi:putative membrane protein insertion efficiency factor